MSLLSKLPLPSALKKFVPGGRKQETKSKVPVRRVACDFGRSKILLLEVEISDSGVTLLKFDKLMRAKEDIADSNTIREAFDKGAYGSSKIRISLKGQGVIVRFLQFPQMKPEELRSSISFEIDQYIPFKSHEVVWDFHIIEAETTLSSGGKGMSVLLVAVKREELYAELQIFQNAGLEVELIDVDALASINALEYFYPEKFQKSAAILDIGNEVSTLSVVQEGKPRFIRDISYGGVDLLKRLKRKLGLTHEQALEAIHVDRAPSEEAGAVLKEGLGDLVGDLKVSFNYYLDQIPGAETIQSLFIGGGGGYHPFVIEVLKTELGIEVETMDVSNKIRLHPDIDKTVLKRNQGLLPIPLGLLLRDL